MAQFIKQMCPSAYDADAVAASGRLLKECPANARGGSNDNDGFIVHCFFACFISILIA